MMPETKQISATLSMTTVEMVDDQPEMVYLSFSQMVELLLREAIQGRVDKNKKKKKNVRV